MIEPGNDPAFMTALFSRIFTPGLPAGSVIGSDGFEGSKILSPAEIRAAASADGVPLGGGTSNLFAMRQGRYYSAYASQQPSTLAITPNSLIFLPIVIPEALTVTRIGIHVAIAAAGSARLGVYNDVSGVPAGSPFLDAGAVDLGTTGEKEIIISQLLSAGRYWLGIVASSAATLIAENLGTDGSNVPNLGLVSATGNAITHLTQSHAFAALPSVGTLTAETTKTPPRVWIRDYTPPPGVDVRYLIVGGGGGGGRWYGSGGGGGGVLPGTGLRLASGTSYAVTVGDGGARETVSSSGSGTNGGSSVFGNLTAIGGGAGVHSNGGSRNGSTGGSGGGGAGSSGLGGAGALGQGYAGGNGSATAGGGGGGAGAVGVTATHLNGGAGGAGVTSDITGTSLSYGGGGGGSADTVGAGGAGGGGAGANDAFPGTSGTANRGGGGGGGSGTYPGGAGGKGVVIIRAPQTAASTTGSPTVTTVGDDTVYTFNSSGTITF
jgi:hypothetical protein